jgi:hypothetical protein
MPPASSNAGRLDLALRFNEQVYLFEFKVVEIEPDDRALQQIKDKNYAAPYSISKSSVSLLLRLVVLQHCLRLRA